MGALKGCVVAAADRREREREARGEGGGEGGRERRGSHGNIGSERIDAVENSRCHLNGEGASGKAALES